MRTVWFCFREPISRRSLTEFEMVTTRHWVRSVETSAVPDAVRKQQELLKRLKAQGQI